MNISLGDPRCVLILDDNDERDELHIQHLKDLVAFEDAPGAGLKIIFTCQSSSGVVKLPNPCVMIDLESQAMTESEMEAFTSRAVSVLIQKRPMFTFFRDRITTEIRGSKNIFWITLVLEHLATSSIPLTRTSIGQNLKYLSSTMPNFIEDTLRCIPDWATKALMWILHAARAMTIEELAIAISIEAGAISLVAIEDRIPLDLSTDLQHVFGPLIKIENERISMAHRHIKDIFVAKHSAAWNIASHWNITILCITYLNMEELHKTKLVSTNSILSWPQGHYHKFLDYAVKYWPYHYRRVIDKTLCSEYIIKFLNDRKLIFGFSDIVKVLLNRDSGTIDELDRALALSLAVQNGYHDVARLVVDGICNPVAIEIESHQVCTNGDQLMAQVLIDNILSRSEKANLPSKLICRAARNGHVSVVKRLIDAGSSISLAHTSEYSHKARTMTEQRTAYAKGSVQREDHTIMSPLHLAALSGHYSVVRLLLDHDAGLAISCHDETPLLLAISNGHLAAAEQLITRKVDVNFSNSNSLSALHIAVDKGFNGTVALLLSNGAKPQAENITGSTPLHLASKSGNMKIVDLLLTHGAAINVVDEDRHTALYYAAKSGSEAITCLLLSKDASPNLEDDLNSSPLIQAASNGLTLAIQQMLGKGMNTEAMNQKGNTAIHCATKAGHREIVRLLLNNGANPHIPNNVQQGALHLAASTGFEEITALLFDSGADLSALDSKHRSALDVAVVRKCEAVVALLQDRGPVVNKQNGKQRTVLHRAAQAGSLNIVRSLLSEGASPDKKDYIEWTPLHYAASNGFEDVGLLLLEYKADPIAEDKDGWTPLHLAAQSGKVKIMEELQHFYEDTNVRTRDGRTPLHFAYQEISTAQWLLDRGADVDATDKESSTVLMAAAYATKIPIVDLLLNCGARVNIISTLKGTALHMAACSGSVDIVLRLLARGADVTAIGGEYPSILQATAAQPDVTVVQDMLKTTQNVNIMGGRFGSPLGAAAARCPDAVPFFLERSAELNIQDAQGRTLLHLAASHNRWNIWIWIEDAGCKLQVRDKQGRAVLHHATSGGEYLSGLLFNLEDKTELVSSEDGDGWTPLHWACKGGRRAIIDQLRDAGADYRKECRRGWTPRQSSIFHGHDDLSILFNYKRNSDTVVMKKVIDEMFCRVEEGTRHRGVKCDGCVFDIYGIRFKCRDCFDFSFCFKCYWSHEETHPNHTFFELGSGPVVEPHVEKFDHYQRLWEVDPEDYELEEGDSDDVESDDG
ncbi:Ankyrin-2 [Xylographa bjoerkii]|nr:Ankyrin-2 [Xylographa bjoerkii]